MSNRKSVAIALVSMCCLALLPTSADAWGNRGYSVKDGPAIGRHSWSGCYAGLQIGWARADVDGVDTTLAGTNPAAYDYSVDGAVGGGHIGCNHQFGAFVVGVEADFEGVAGDGDTDTLAPSTTLYNHATDLNWMGSVRGRLGYARGTHMFYVTAGWAWAGVDHDFGFAGATSPFHSYSETRDGWTVGGGVEWLVLTGVTARVEYRYTDLGDITDANAPQNSLDRNEMTIHAVRMGVSMKF